MSTEQTAAIQKVTRNKLAIRERQKTALELRLAGDTFQSIADKLGCSKHTAHSLYEKALDATIKEPAARIREAELLRLDGIFAGFWPAAQRGDPVAAAGCLKVMEHRAKLLGLYAVGKMELLPNDTGLPNQYENMSDQELAELMRRRMDLLQRVAPELVLVVHSPVDPDLVTGGPPAAASSGDNGKCAATSGNL